jgi:hypothetical protein
MELWRRGADEAIWRYGGMEVCRPRGALWARGRRAAEVWRRAAGVVIWSPGRTLAVAIWRYGGMEFWRRAAGVTI